MSGGVATDSGGGIAKYGGTLTLTNSTVSGNSADYGGGVYNLGGTATLARTLVSGNTAASGGVEFTVPLAPSPPTTSTSSATAL